jgi:hypothetical protein
MVLFRISLVAAWFVMVPITIHALTVQGISGLGIFVRDFDHPWRAQINSDFCVYLCLAMAWIVYREPTRARGVTFALPVLLGSVYLLPYILVSSLTCDGRFDTLLLGSRCQASDLPGC